MGQGIQFSNRTHDCTWGLMISHGCAWGLMVSHDYTWGLMMSLDCAWRSMSHDSTWQLISLDHMGIDVNIQQLLA